MIKYPKAIFWVTCPRWQVTKSKTLLNTYSFDCKAHLLFYLTTLNSVVTVTYTIKGFSIVSEGEADFFWNTFAFSMIQWMLAIWSLVPLPFLNPAYTSGNSWFMYCWSLTWRILSITFSACEWVQLYDSLNNLWHCSSLGLELKLTFSVLWSLLSFPNLLTYWV